MEKVSSPGVEHHGAVDEVVLDVDGDESSRLEREHHGRRTHVDAHRLRADPEPVEDDGHARDEPTPAHRDDNDVRRGAELLDHLPRR